MNHRPSVPPTLPPHTHTHAERERKGNIITHSEYSLFSVMAKKEVIYRQPSLEVTKLRMWRHRTDGNRVE